MKSLTKMKRLCWRTRFGRGILLAIAAGILFSGPVALLAQDVTSAPAAPVGADGKRLTFDVVSVREVESEPTPQSPVQNSPIADGYRLKGLPLIAVIQIRPVRGGPHLSPQPDHALPEKLEWQAGASCRNPRCRDTSRQFIAKPCSKC